MTFFSCAVDLQLHPQTISLPTHIYVVIKWFLFKQTFNLPLFLHVLGL